MAAVTDSSDALIVSNVSTVFLFLGLLQPRNKSLEEYTEIHASVGSFVQRQRPEPGHCSHDVFMIAS